jgi:hypothetical protein
MEYPILDKIPIIPLVKNFQATTIFNAILLAGILQTIILSITLSTHDIFKKYEINPFWKWTISILYIFIITILSYTIMYVLFGFGRGMLSVNN